MKVLTEFITETGKKKIKYIFGMGSSNTESYNNNDFYCYLTEEWPDIYILNQSY